MQCSGKLVLWSKFNEKSEKIKLLAVVFEERSAYRKLLRYVGDGAELFPDPGRPAKSFDIFRALLCSTTIDKLEFFELLARPDDKTWHLLRTERALVRIEVEI